MNIAQVLKAEISRISKKEAKALSSPTRSAAIQLKKTVAALKTRMAVLEKEVQRLTVLAVNLAATQPAPAAEEPEARGWISGKGVKSLRKKTGLSQKEFGKLTGVSLSAVVQWESKSGMLKLRDKTKKAIMAIRGIGKAEARKKLDETAPAKDKKVKAAKRKVKGKKIVARRRK